MEQIPLKTLFNDIAGAIHEKDGQTDGIAAEDFPARIRAIPSGGESLPAGCIVMWSGAAADIPDGYALCNGENGTPDLRDRFVVGAGGTYAVGATGGSKEVTLSIAQMPAHTHEVPDLPFTGGTTSGSSSGSYSRITDQITKTSKSTGGSQPHNNLPPYYALCFIMKI